MKPTIHPRLSWRWKALIPLIGLTLLGMPLLAHYFPPSFLIQHIFRVSGIVATVLVVMFVVLRFLKPPLLGKWRRMPAGASKGARPARVVFGGGADEIGQLGSDFNR